MFHLVKSLARELTYGFTTVIDVRSYLHDTLVLAELVEKVGL